MGIKVANPSGVQRNELLEQVIDTRTGREYERKKAPHIPPANHPFRRPVKGWAFFREQSYTKKSI